LEKADDAAVYRLSPELAVIHTLDFFTPIVDDPHEYGAIAATNALSDVYAMGGEVLLALNICAFPADMEPGVISDILRGGAEKVAEAGAVLAGGHTVDDKEPKYGLSVVGVVHPDRVWTKSGAQPGDALILTKPLGVGIISTVHKGGVADAAHMAAATASMMTLNRRAAQLAQRVGVRAATDITGFSLLGHASEMASQGSVGMRFHIGEPEAGAMGLPFLPGAREYADQWLFPAGSNRNQEYFGCGVSFASDIPEELRLLLFTPETSGGLLLAVPAARVAELQRLAADSTLNLWTVGEVTDGAGIEVVW
jgi:selenide,water dikinase